jgi:hypothetical protein
MPNDPDHEESNLRAGEDAADDSAALPDESRSHDVSPTHSASVASASQRRPLRDEDEDDDDEDEEDDEPPPPKRRRRAPARAVVGPPWNEKTIDSPSRFSLGMIGSVALATVAMWGAGKFACNAHPPETRKPKLATAAELARDPKSTAFELQQRWSAYDFAAAALLATGPVLQEIKKDQERCAQNRADCEQKRESLKDTPLTLAALVARTPQAAKVKVKSLGGLAGQREFAMDVVQEGGKWKVASRSPWVEPAPAAAPAAPLGAAPATLATPATPATAAAGRPAPAVPPVSGR